MRRLVPLLLALFLACGLAAAATPAYAAESERIVSQDVTYTLNRDGSMHVHETIVWQFGEGEHRGIMRRIRVTQPWPDDPRKERVFRVSRIRVTDEAGANQTFATRQTGNAGLIRIGDPGRVFHGAQRRTYVLDYDMAAMVNHRGDSAQLALDVRLEEQVPADRLRVTVVGPAPATAAECRQGPEGATFPCLAGAGERSTYEATGLAADEGMTIGATFPRGAFDRLEPKLATRGEGSGLTQASAVNADSLPPWAIAVTAAAVLMFLVVVATKLIARSRAPKPEFWPDLPPGVLPARGTEPRVAQGRRTGEVPVRFEPPDGVEASRLAALLGGKAVRRGPVALLFELAARGYLTIEPRGRRLHLTLTGKVPGPDLPKRGGALISAIQKDEVEPGRGIGTDAKTVRRELATIYRDLVRLPKQTKWAQIVKPGERRQTVLTALVFIASVFLLIGSVMVSAFMRGFYAPLPVAPWQVVVPLIVLSFGLCWVPTAPASVPTAKGTALTEQAQGYRHYLETAEARQIRFEEAEDIFSRNLPYAIAFGLADRWVRVFDEVRARAAGSGHQIGAPFWFAAGSFDGLDRGIGGAESSVNTAMGRSGGGGGWGGSGGSGGGSYSGGSSGGSSSSSGGGDSGFSSSSW
ncbi:hypothetical protein GCM10028815_17900 [Mariniluteicoccus flavus]